MLDKPRIKEGHAPVEDETPNDDGAPKGVVYVPVENAAANKAREIKGVSPDALYARAEGTLETVQDELEAAVREQVAALSNQLDAVAARPGANAAELRALAERAFELKGLAGGVGYPLITQIGEAVYRIARRLNGVEGRTLEILSDLVGGIEMVLERRLRDDGGDEGRALIDELSAQLRQVIGTRHR